MVMFQCAVCGEMAPLAGKVDMTVTVRYEREFAYESGESIMQTDFCRDCARKIKYWLNRKNASRLPSSADV